jgi:hypothetical protein
LIGSIVGGLWRLVAIFWAILLHLLLRAFIFLLIMCFEANLSFERNWKTYLFFLILFTSPGRFHILFNDFGYLLEGFRTFGLFNDQIFFNCFLCH